LVRIAIGRRRAAGDLFDAFDHPGLRQGRGDARGLPLRDAQRAAQRSAHLLQVQRAVQAGVVLLLQAAVEQGRLHLRDAAAGAGRQVAHAQVPRMTHQHTIEIQQQTLHGNGHRALSSRSTADRIPIEARAATSRRRQGAGTDSRIAWTVRWRSP